MTNRLETQLIERKTLGLESDVDSVILERPCHETPIEFADIDKLSYELNKRKYDSLKQNPNAANYEAIKYLLKASIKCCYKVFETLFLWPSSIRKCSNKQDKEGFDKLSNADKDKALAQLVLPHVPGIAATIGFLIAFSGTGNPIYTLPPALAGLNLIYEFSRSGFLEAREKIIESYNPDKKTKRFRI